MPFFLSASLSFSDRKSAPVDCAPSDPFIVTREVAQKVVLSERVPPPLSVPQVTYRPDSFAAHHIEGPVVAHTSQEIASILLPGRVVIIAASPSLSETAQDLRDATVIRAQAGSFGEVRISVSPLKIRNGVLMSTWYLPFSQFPWSAPAPP